METEVDDGGSLSLGSPPPNLKPAKPVSYPAMQRRNSSALQELSIPTFIARGACGADCGEWPLRLRRLHQDNLAGAESASPPQMHQLQLDMLKLAFGVATGRASTMDDQVMGKEKDLLSQHYFVRANVNAIGVERVGRCTIASLKARLRKNRGNNALWMPAPFAAFAASILRHNIVV